MSVNRESEAEVIEKKNYLNILKIRIILILGNRACSKGFDMFLKWWTNGQKEHRVRTWAGVSLTWDACVESIATSDTFPSSTEVVWTDSLGVSLAPSIFGKYNACYWSSNATAIRKKKKRRGLTTDTSVLISVLGPIHDFPSRAPSLL